MQSLISNTASMINNEGREVTIAYKTPKLDHGAIVKDNNDRIVYETTEIITKCMMNWKDNYDHMDGEVKLGAKYIKAMFKFTDSDYLKKGSEITYTDPNTSIEFTFKVRDLIPRRTHLQVLLV